MKIKPEHIEVMFHAIGNASKAPTRATYRELGLSAMRWRWDVARSAGLTPFFCKEIYQYANDNHIDTALRSILGDE